MSPSGLQISKSRIESLSDVIFGLALAISTIPLISRLPARPSGMFTDVAEFGFSFLILISVWMGYTNIMSALPVEESSTLNLNLLLLFLVSVEPYLFYLNITFDLLTHEIFLYYASILYALDMTGLMLILALFTNQLAKEEKGFVAKEFLRSVRKARNGLYLSAALFAISALSAFLDNQILGSTNEILLLVRTAHGIDGGTSDETLKSADDSRTALEREY